MIDRQDPAWKKAAAAFKKAKLGAAPVLAELEKARTNIIALAGENSAQGFGVIATMQRRAGTVSYAEILELRDVDLGAYRKPDTFYFEVGLALKSTSRPA